MRTLPLAVLALCVPVMMSAQTRFPSSEESLRGVKQVMLLMDFQDSGADTTSLRNHIELRLRQAGFKVVESSSDEVQLQANVMSNKGLRVFDYSLNYRCIVRKIGNPFDSFYATAWRYSGIATVGENYFEEGFKTAIDQTLDAFLNVWMKVNASQ